MSKKRDFVKVSARVPRFREDSTLMRAHETMVDFIKGNTSTSFMDMFGSGIFGFMQNLDVDPDRDLIYSDDEEEDDDFDKQNHIPTLKPHPQLKEIDDKEAELLKESLEEEQKRKSKSIKNKRKKMRKKEKKRQEKADGDQNVSPEEEQGKSDSSEYEDVNEDINHHIDNYKEINKPMLAICDKPHNEEKNNKVIKQQKTVLITNKDNPPANIDPKKPTLSITEPVPEKKSKKKSKKMEKTQTAQNNKTESCEVKLPGKEEPTVNEAVKIKTKETTEIKQEGIKADNKKETVGLLQDEYTKKSTEMAAIGNRLAANGQYEMAIKCFTEAIKFNPTEYKLFGNRSFCFEKMQQFEAALSDAEVSLSMEPNWIKGLFRKGKALCGLKKYYEASLAYRDVLKLDSSSQEASMELKRSQTLHLMEMGFTWTQSTNAIKSHATLEEAIEALFNGDCDFSEENGACKLDVSHLSRADYTVQDTKEWENSRLPPKTRPQFKEKVQAPAPLSKKQGKLDVFPVWVGSLAPTVDYLTLQEVFSRAGKVVSIKMVLEHHCAFVNYTRREDTAQAIQMLNGLVLEGSPLSVRYPSRIPPGIGVSKDALTDPHTPPSVEKECFFWRTIGCTRQDCTFIHNPKNKGIDRSRFNSKLNHF